MHEFSRDPYINLINYYLQLKKEQVCLIRNHGNYLTWIKEEILSVDPWVTLIYDVISTKEANRFKLLSLRGVSFTENVHKIFQWK